MFRLLGRKHRSRETLTEYLDDRLSPGERRKVELHLNACQQCGQDIESLRATVDLLQRAPIVQPRRSFVLSEVPLEATNPAQRTLPNWAVGLATSAAVLAFVAVLSTDLAGGLTPGKGSDERSPLETAAAAESQETEQFTAPPTSLKRTGDSAPVQEAAPASEETVTTSSASPDEIPPQEMEGLANEGLEVGRSGEGVQPEAPASQEVTPTSRVQASDSSSSAETVPLSGDASTPIYWRVIEGALAGLAALLVGAFIWRRHRAGAL